MKLQERFTYICEYISSAHTVKFYDVKHFEEKAAERGGRIHQPRAFIINAILRGSREIESTYNFAYGDYMIISKSIGVKIPVSVRPDKFTAKPIGLIPTLLTVESAYDLQRDYYTNVLIESKNHPTAIQLVDSFIDFYENGERVPSYEKIDIDDLGDISSFEAPREFHPSEILDAFLKCTESDEHADIVGSIVGFCGYNSITLDELIEACEAGLRSGAKYEGYSHLKFLLQILTKNKDYLQAML